MSYKYEPQGVEPNKALLRRKEVIQWTGVTIHEFDLIANAVPVILPYKIFRPGGRRYYRKSDVVKAFFKGFRGE